MDLITIEKYFRALGCTCRNMARVGLVGEHGRNCPLFRLWVIGRGQ